MFIKVMTVNRLFILPAAASAKQKATSSCLRMSQLSMKDQKMHLPASTADRLAAGVTTSRSTRLRQAIPPLSTNH